ncbi:MAG: bifunctional adenosylcobinamide kinase/adenosylcobinamide-phosphate guanylyltransferase, partial [Coriobacteriales bacterium]|nr:bifunctional adenosylcobinamide kinase/adenosylcobinamide-phosphate guanylyltransferase [Coriobacteriales bacterium]
MRTLISGGCKNGKTRYALKLARSMGAENLPYYYLATMIPTDHEDTERIIRHQQEQERIGFQTVEAGKNILKAIEGCDRNGSFV